MTDHDTPSGAGSTGPDTDPFADDPSRASGGPAGSGESGGPGGPDRPGGGSGPGGPEDGARARRILTDIAPRTWEHPADKAALQALRRIPVFDQVLRALFGFFGEKPIRLAFQANAVRVGPTQFPRIHELYLEVCRTLDVKDEYPLFVSQTPMVNAGAYGMRQPFIILNSGTAKLLDDEELAFVLAHEVGHIESDHVLYRTMTVLLIQLARMGFPVVGLAARAVLVGLLEWYRKSELSSDRAGLLAIQEPKVAMSAMLKMAGGGSTDEMDLDAFIAQAEEYREGGDVADQVYKVLNTVWTTHPFWVHRVSEIRSWIESGAYDRILRGEYARHDEPDPVYEEDLRAAATAYSEEARDFMDHMTGAARRMADSIMEGLRK
ncbi:MAG: M48 family metallopeptidase [Gemmatimonadota bacterium]